MTFSATSITQPRCRVELAEGARDSAIGKRDAEEEEEEEKENENIEKQ